MPNRDVVGHARGLAPCGVVSPHLGQVDVPVDQRPALRRGVGQEHRDLRVLDPPRRAGVLALDPDRRDALLQIAGVVQDQHTISLAELVGHVTAHIVTDVVRVPHRLAQQPLHRVRGRVSGLLGQLPTRPRVHIGQQSQQKRTNPPSRLNPSEPASDPRERRVEVFLPCVYVYSGIHGHRTVMLVHNDHDRAVAAPMPIQHPM